MHLTSDLRYALRALQCSPVFSLVAVLSLAFGIGANAAIFTLINAVILRTLPVREPDRLVQITRLMPNGRPASVSYPLFQHFLGQLTSIESGFVQGTVRESIGIDGDEDLVTIDLVSGGWQAVLGIVPAAGRLLGPSDDVESPSAPAAVITDRYWLRRFGRNVSAIGSTVAIRDRVFTIVGVTSPRFESARRGNAPDLIVPLAPLLSENQRREMGFNWLSLLARLKPGATVEQANAEVQVVWRALLQSQADQVPEKARADLLRQRAEAFASADGFNPLRYETRLPLLILMGTSGLILLLACVNLSGLLLARGAARQREVAVRLALGAGRGRLIRHLLAENLVIASLGGAIGLAIAYGFSARLVTLFANGRELELSVAPDWRVLAFTAGVSLSACVLAGLAPAVRALRSNPNPALKDVRVQGHRRLGTIFVVAQLALSMILVVGATLFIATLVKLYAVERGFDSEGVLVVNVRSTRPYPPERIRGVQGALVARLESLAGVRSVSAAQVLPIGGGLWTRDIQVDGYAFRADESNQVGFNVIAPGYFTTLETPLLAGREFDHRDGETAPRVAIVNESFARYFFGDRPALGRRVTSVDVTYEIVGVVRDAKYQSLRDPILKTMYIPWMQRDGDQPTRYSYLVRVAAGDPLRLAPGLERLVRDADPALRVRTAITYRMLVDRSIVTERIMATLGGLFGALALVVAGLGLFGVLAFQVARRTNELGVRMALGASRSAIARLILRDVLGILVVGISIGAGLALLVTGLARSILFELTPTDPLAFVLAAVVLGSAGALAGWLPARRASRVDPLVALRHD
jgi:predicted permease